MGISEVLKRSMSPPHIMFLEPPKLSSIVLESTESCAFEHQTSTKPLPPPLSHKPKSDGFQPLLPGVPERKIRHEVPPECFSLDRNDDDENERKSEVSETPKSFCLNETNHDVVEQRSEGSEPERFTLA